MTGSLEPIRPGPSPLAYTKTDRRARAALVAWAGLVFVISGLFMWREARTLADPVARVIFEDILMIPSDGRTQLPTDEEILKFYPAQLPAGPLTILEEMLYFPLTDLSNGAVAFTVRRLLAMFLYLLGTPMVYRLLRYGRADRHVAFVLAATYAISPFVFSRVYVWANLPAAQFLLWSELARLEGRPVKRALGFVASAWSHPLTGIPASVLAFQDYRTSSGRQRAVNLRILVVTVGALLVTCYGLVQWNLRHPEMLVGSDFINDSWRLRHFPYEVPLILQPPLKLFETALFMAGSCVFLLFQPHLWLPLAADLLYYVATDTGIRQHATVMMTIALFTIVGVRASLFVGGNPFRNRVLIAGALVSMLYGFAFAGPVGFVHFARAKMPPPPHLADIRACVSPGHSHCVVLDTLYPGFDGYCDRLTLYQPADLKDLRIDEPGTALFVAPSRFDVDAKGTPYGPDPQHGFEFAKVDSQGNLYGPDTVKENLRALAAKIRSGQLSATMCPPWFAVVRAPGSGRNDPAAADWLERQAQ